MNADMSPLDLAGRLALGAAMAVFVGLAFEETYKTESPTLPGGIRTFPMLSLVGSLLFLVEPAHGSAFIAGVLGLSAWLYAYVRKRATANERLSLMIPTANMLAYGMGPLAIIQARWILVGVSVAAALLLTQRERLHRLVHAIPGDEIVTAGKFLILAGVIFPLVPHERVIASVPITPYQVLLAVLAVSTLSYGSYLLQRYVPMRNEALLSAVLGGLYSSTATTVVLAREQAQIDQAKPELSAGIVIATAVMYLRIGVILFVFDAKLALKALPVLALAFVVGVAIALYERARPGTGDLKVGGAAPANPLQLGTAALFATLFVLVSVAASWVSTHLGAAGVLALAAVVGFTDIDPFVLNLAQGGAPDVSVAVMAAAIVIASSSNNVLKAAYALGFGGRRCRRPAIALALLCAIGIGGAVLLLRG
jgi:uncharacterized membrane protein (DUF4010 family)